MSKVEEGRPEVVLLEHLQESDFWGKIQSLMRHQGYTGSIEDSRHGRVKGVFVRNDLRDRRNQSEGGTFYKSRMPDPYWCILKNRHRFVTHPTSNDKWPRPPPQPNVYLSVYRDAKIRISMNQIDQGSIPLSTIVIIERFVLFLHTSILNGSCISWLVLLAIHMCTCFFVGFFFLVILFMRG